MLDLKATLKKAKMTPYRLGKELNRHSQQMYRYVNGQNMSPLLEEKVRGYFQEKGIDIVEK